MLRHRIISVILLEDLNPTGVVQRTQEHRIRLKMSRDIGDLHVIYTRVQIKRQLLPHYRELLVIDRQCRRRAFLIRVIGGPD